MKTATEKTIKEDTDVKLPAAVKAAAARADELRTAMYGEDQKAEDAPGETSEKAPETTPEITPTTDPTISSEPSDKAQTEDQKTVPATPVVTPEDEESAERKYKAAVGRLKKANEELRTATARISDLERIIATMQTATPPRADTSDEPAKSFDPATLFTEEEIADYGEDLLGIIGKRARAEFAPVLESYKEEIAQLRARLDGVSGTMQQDTRERLFTKLDTDVPRWRELNTDENFLVWLGLPDPYSGGIRHDMLKAAYANGDATRVAAFFNGFLAEEAAVEPAVQDPDPSGQTRQKVPLKDLAAPGKAKTAATSDVPPEKPFITRAQISKFYADVTSGAYRGRDEEKARMESEIFAAQRDGRIQ